MFEKEEHLDAEEVLFNIVPMIGISLRSCHWLRNADDAVEITGYARRN